MRLLIFYNGPFLTSKNSIWNINRAFLSVCARSLTNWWRADVLLAHHESGVRSKKEKKLKSFASHRGKVTSLVLVSVRELCIALGFTEMSIEHTNSLGCGQRQRRSSLWGRLIFSHVYNSHAWGGGISNRRDSWAWGRNPFPASCFRSPRLQSGWSWLNYCAIVCVVFP